MSLRLPVHLVRSILGRRLCQAFALRPMRASDCRHFLDDVEKFFYGVRLRTCQLSLTIAAKEGARKPVLALVSAKGASRKTTIIVHATGKSEALAPDEYLRMLAVALLEVQTYGMQTGAKRVRVNKIPPQLVGFFEKLGYRIETKKRLLYAVREFDAPTTH